MSRPPSRWPTRRATATVFWEQLKSHLAWPHRKVLDAIVRWPHRGTRWSSDQCVRCGHQAISFNSCRNRHSPKCQGSGGAQMVGGALG